MGRSIKSGVKERNHDLNHKLPTHVKINSNLLSDSIKSIVKTQLKKNKFITIEKEDFGKYATPLLMNSFDKVIASTKSGEYNSPEEMSKDIYSHYEPAIQFLTISCLLTPNNERYTIDSLSYTINFYPPPPTKPVEKIIPISFIRQGNIPGTFVALIDSLSK